MNFPDSSQTPATPGNVVLVRASQRTPQFAGPASSPVPVPPTTGPSAKPTPGGRRGAPVWLRVFALSTATLVALAAGFGVGMMIHVEASTEPFELYLTDAQMNLNRLDVELDSVRLGDSHLQIVTPQFDLASLQGPEDALLVARGEIPVGATGKIAIHFKAVHATIGGVTFQVPDPQPLLIDPRLGEGLPGASLVDIDLPASVLQTAEGVTFAPQAAALYAIEQVQAGQVPDWRNATQALPAPDGTFAIVPSDPDLADPNVDPAAAVKPARDIPLAVAEQAPNGTELIVDPGETGVKGPASVSAETRTGWIVQFTNDTDSEFEMRTTVDTSGALFVDGMQSLPFAYVLANPLQAELLSKDRKVIQMEPEVVLQFDDAESRQSIRQPQVVDLVTGLRDRSGNPIDGRGIGVAVVDTGIDTLHPDLSNAVNTVVVANYKVESNQVIPLAHTDTSGHGTHVAAIVAGQGVQDPAMKGVAPGADLYGLGIAEGSTNVWATQAFDWILQNHASVNPPIRVVTNSWNTGTSYSSTSAITQFVNAMVARGLVVVFSAGNNAGDGTSIQTSAQCQIPTPGVICVAAFDDMGTGTRDGKLPDYTSRGLQSQPSTWPDVSAPGTKVMSAKPPVGITTGANLNPYYVELTGTSQSAPHVAGVVALMLQMRPSLSPAAVELDLKITAYRYSDGGAYGLQGHLAKGHGLVDAYAAVQLVS